MSRINVSENKLIIKGANAKKNPVVNICVVLGIISLAVVVALALYQFGQKGEIRNVLWSISQMVTGFAIFIMMVPVFAMPDIIFDKQNRQVKVTLWGFTLANNCSIDDIEKITAKSDEKIYHGEYTRGKYWSREIGLFLKNGSYIPVATGNDFSEINYVIAELSRFLGVPGEDISSMSEDKISFQPQMDTEIIIVPSAITENRTITYETPFYQKPIYENRHSTDYAGSSSDSINITKENDSYGIYVTPGNRFRSITGGAKYLTGCSCLYVPIMILAVWAILTDKRHPPVETFKEPGFIIFFAIGAAIVFFTFKSIIKKMGKPISFQIDSKNLIIETEGSAPVVMELDSINDMSAESSAEMEAFLVIRQGSKSTSISNSLTVSTAEQIYRELHRMANELKNERQPQ
ncbi:MAG: photosystem I assembly protein Ycf4 [Firmicutes bacterium]|nr:photosystem I assembly protein Ycf4 [Bacillota bacterium]